MIIKFILMVIVRLKIMVRKKVISNMVIFDLGFFSNVLNVCYLFILYDMMINIFVR